MDASSQKRIAADIMKCGVSRVRMKQGEEVEDALTREDIRGLIQKGLIWKLQKKGTSKFATKLRLEQKSKGRMRGPGKRKGTRGARKNSKVKWIEKVRPLRSLLFELRDNGSISHDDFKVLYRMIKGGFFRNKNHLLYYIKEKDMFTPGVTKRSAAQKSRPRKARPARTKKQKPKKAEKPKDESK